MSDRSVFSDDEWKALTEAPLRITLALVTVGEHSPISLVKEAAASARATTHSTERGPADELIKEIAREAESREARHDVKTHLGQQPSEIVEQALAALAPTVQALEKLSADEAAEIRAWLIDIAKAVAGAAKSVTADEQGVIDKITALFSGPAA
jgi:hypothetical protein